jgi:hypothetical protein
VLRDLVVSLATDLAIEPDRDGGGAGGAFVEA